jgi:hypothetical protein
MMTLAPATSYSTRWLAPENFRFVGRRLVAQIDGFAGRFHPLKIVVLDVNGRHVGGQAHRTLADNDIAFIDANAGFLVDLAAAGFQLNGLVAVFRQGGGQWRNQRQRQRQSEFMAWGVHRIPLTSESSSSRS